MLGESKEGPCHSSGFSEATGTKELELPILGKLSFGIFRKPGARRSRPKEGVSSSRWRI